MRLLIISFISLSNVRLGLVDLDNDQGEDDKMVDDFGLPIYHLHSSHLPSYDHEINLLNEEDEKEEEKYEMIDHPPLPLSSVLSQVKYHLFYHIYLYIDV